MQRFLLVLACFSTLPACALFAGDDGADVPDAPPLAQLRAAPVSVVADGKTLALSTYMWRDFMPPSPPDGKPLIALFRVSTVDSTAFPKGLRSDAAFLVRSTGDVWSTGYTGQEEATSERRPYRYQEIARDGPKWGPGERVDVVVRLRDEAGRTHLLRAPAQLIGRTD